MDTEDIKLLLCMGGLFLQVYPDQALLLLVTGALALRVFDGVLSPAAPVLNTYQVICPSSSYYVSVKVPLS